jgi:hypothetical protein
MNSPHVTHIDAEVWVYGYSFRLTGANEPIIKKNILKCQKNWNKHSACTSWHIIFVHKFLEEKNIFMSYIKRQIYVWTYHYLEDIFLSFLPMPHTMFFVVENLCANIECPDLHVKFIFKFFWHLKLVFYAFSIIGSYAPESQNTSSLSVTLFGYSVLVRIAGLLKTPFI